MSGGKPTGLDLTAEELERFWVKVDKTEDCWIWTASIVSSGYGQFWITRDKKYRLNAHRVAYELLVGPIPDGLQLDHLCSVRRCVSPAHLEPVTCRENLLRSSKTLPGINARKTHCYQGHEFTPENTGLHHGNRYCRTCYRATGARQRAKRAGAAA